MADKLGGAAGPQPPEGSVEYRYAQVAREPRCEQEPVRFRHAAMYLGRQGTAGGMVAVVGYSARRADPHWPVATKVDQGQGTIGADRHHQPGFRFGTWGLATAAARTGCAWASPRRRIAPTPRHTAPHNAPAGHRTGSVPAPPPAAPRDGCDGSRERRGTDAPCGVRSVAGPGRSPASRKVPLKVSPGGIRHILDLAPRQKGERRRPVERRPRRRQPHPRCIAVTELPDHAVQSRQRAVPVVELRRREDESPTRVWWFRTRRIAAAKWASPFEEVLRSAVETARKSPVVGGGVPVSRRQGGEFW